MLVLSVWFLLCKAEVMAKNEFGIHLCDNLRSSHDLHVAFEAGLLLHSTHRLQMQQHFLRHLLLWLTVPFTLVRVAPIVSQS